MTNGGDLDLDLYASMKGDLNWRDSKIGKRSFGKQEGAHKLRFAVKLFTVVC